MPGGIFQQSVEVFLAQKAPQNLPPVFDALHAEATRRSFPIVGPEVGRFFLQLARLRRPRRILELGSGFGYSAIWWALGAGPGVEVDCTEYKRENIELGRGFAKQAGVSERLVWHEGEALRCARPLGGSWDIIFCDIDKHDYPKAYAWAKRIMRSGDIVLFDNMLWSGKLAAPEEEWDKETEGIAETLGMAYTDNDMDVSLIPLRDGLLMGVRK